MQLSLLPHDLQTYCLHYLDLRALLAACCVDGLWQQLCGLQLLPRAWHAQCAWTWKMLRTVGWNPVVDWKRVYQEHARLLCDTRVFPIVYQLIPHPCKVPSKFRLEDVFFTVALQDIHGATIATWASPMTYRRTVESFSLAVSVPCTVSLRNGHALSVFVTWHHHTARFFRTEQYDERGLFYGAKKGTDKGALFEITPVITQQRSVHLLFEELLSESGRSDLAQAQVEQLLWACFKAWQGQPSLPLV